jgi:hypothetical protein
MFKNIQKVFLLELFYWNSFCLGDCIVGEKRGTEKGKI